jgi:beta-lactamase regulating signal transducer with metallopeptidase domain
MTELWMAAAQWLAHAAMGGGLLLLLVCGGMALVRQPARRQRLGEWGTAAAFLLAVLALAPAWFYVSLPLPAGEAAAPGSRMEPPPVAAWHRGTDAPRAPASISSADVTDPPPVPAGIVYYFPADGVEPVEAPPPAASAAPTSAPARPLDGHFAIRLLLAVYVAGAAFLIGRWLIGYWWLWRLVAAGRPAPQAVTRLFEEMAAGLQPLPRLLVSRRLRVPVSCGLLRPTVLVPAAWRRRPAELRWVFAHELTHLRRHDAWSCLLFGVAQPVFFYLPWFWWLRRQVRLCQEYVADAAAAELPEPVEDYAQFLLGLTMAPAVPVGATGVLGNSSDLFRRVTMLLKSPVRVEKRCPVLWSAATAGGLLLVAVFASGVGLRAESNDPAPPARKADEPAPARPAEPPQPPQPEPAVQRLRVLIQNVERTAPADNEQTQKETRKAAEELQKALQQLQNLQPGANPEQIQKEVDKAIAELRKALAQQGDARRQAAEALKGVNVFYRRGGDARLGAHVEPPGPALVDQLGLNKGEGQVIMQVRPESAAAKAGLQVNDILLQLGGKPVPSDPREFAGLIEGIKANEAVDAVVLRKGKKETVKGLTLPEKPNETARFFLQGPAAAIVPPMIPAVPMFPANPQNAVITTTVRTADGFTTRYQEGSLIITLTGSAADGKAKVNEIHVQDGAVANKYESLDKVPKQYQDKVKNLVEMTEKSGAQIEIEKKKR